MTKMGKCNTIPLVGKYVDFQTKKRNFYYLIEIIDIFRQNEKMFLYYKSKRNCDQYYPFICFKH